MEMNLELEKALVDLRVFVSDLVKTLPSRELHSDASSVSTVCDCFSGLLSGEK